MKLLGAGGLSTIGGSADSSVNGGNPYYSGPASDHFDGRVFFNPGGEPPRALGDLLRWQLGGGRRPWPNAWPSPHPPARPDASVAAGALRVTMVGHSSLLVQTKGLNLLTDPVWSERVSPFSFAGPRRRNPPGIRFDDLPGIDAVLVSHNHYDHMDLATLKGLVAQHDPLIVTPLGNDRIIRDAVPAARVEALDWSDAVRLDGGTVHVEAAHHWSARGTHDRRMALWSAFAIETAAGKVYFAGDTGFHEGRNYRAAGKKHGRFRLAILPIGAYEPRWFMEPQHQNPQEAVAAMHLLGARFAAGCHWGTFRLTNEGVEDPRDHLHAALRRAGVPRETFRPMVPGEVWDVPG